MLLSQCLLLSDGGSGGKVDFGEMSECNARSVHNVVFQDSPRLLFLTCLNSVAPMISFPSETACFVTDP